MKWRHQEEAAKKKKDEDAKRQSTAKPLPPIAGDYPQAPPPSDPWPHPLELRSSPSQLPDRRPNLLPVDKGRCSSVESDDDVSVGDVSAGEPVSDEEERSDVIDGHRGVEDGNRVWMGGREERAGMAGSDDEWDMKGSIRADCNGREAIVRNSNIVSVSDILDLRKPSS